MAPDSHHKSTPAFAAAALIGMLVSQVARGYTHRPRPGLEQCMMVFLIMLRNGVRQRAWINMAAPAFKNVASNK